jgi:hypothetical protein
VLYPCRSVGALEEHNFASGFQLTGSHAEPYFDSANAHDSCSVKIDLVDYMDISQTRPECFCNSTSPLNAPLKE